MVFPRKSQLSLLEPLINQVTEGQPLAEWTESTVQRLLNVTSYHRKAVDLEGILSSRKIILHERVAEDSPLVQPLLFESLADRYSGDRALSCSHHAHIVNRGTHYDLYIDSRIARHTLARRFVIAHEIAHTLFYANVNGRIEKRTPLSFGSAQIENICNYVAICILLPKKKIDDEINDFETKNGSLRKRNENFLKFIYRLAVTYEMPWYHVMNRLFLHFNFLPNAASVEFILDDKWYIRWVFQSDSLFAKRLYLPVKGKSANKYVSAKKSFVELLRIISNDAGTRVGQYGSVIVPKNMFNTNYQGNFKQFLSRHTRAEFDVIKVYYRVNSAKSVLTFFPFDGMIVGP